MATQYKFSKDIDAKIYGLARAYWADAKKGAKERVPELRTMVSGNKDDGTPLSLMIKILPNPINPRLANGWKVVAEDKVWEIPADEMERSRYLS